MTGSLKNFIFLRRQREPMHIGELNWQKSNVCSHRGLENFQDQYRRTGNLYWSLKKIQDSMIPGETWATSDSLKHDTSPSESWWNFVWQNIFFAFNYTSEKKVNCIQITNISKENIGRIWETKLFPRICFDMVPQQISEEIIFKKYYNKLVLIFLYIILPIYSI